MGSQRAPRRVHRIISDTPAPGRYEFVGEGRRGLQHPASAPRVSTTLQHHYEAHASAPPFSTTTKHTLQHHASAPRFRTTLAHRERGGGGGGGNAATNQAGSCPTSTLLVAVSISRSAAALLPELRCNALLATTLAFRLCLLDYYASLRVVTGRFAWRCLDRARRFGCVASWRANGTG